MSRISSTDRLARLIAAIPWIVAQDGVSIDEIADRFDYPRQVLLEDLENVLFLVGVPPYTPDTLIEVIIDDDMVWIDYADWFSRPMRLSAPEILSLLAAGEAALAFDKADDAGALARGLAKLRLSTGSTQDTVDVGLGTLATPLLASLRAASKAQVCVDISYYSFSSNERSERRIEPARFFLDSGRWYVGAYCHSAEDERVFRVDRIEKATNTKQAFTSSPSNSPGTFELDAGPEIELSTPVEFAHVFEGVPVRSIETEGDLLSVKLAATSPRWIEQLFLRLGPDAKIVHGELGTSVVDAAQRLKARYE